MAHLMRIEAEAATLDAPMISFPDTQAFGGQYIASNTGGAGTARWSFNVSVPGNYVVWCRVKAPSTNNNSWYVKADSGSEDTFDAAEGTDAAIQPRRHKGARGFETPLLRQQRMAGGQDVTRPDQDASGGTPRRHRRVGGIDGAHLQMADETKRHGIGVGHLCPLVGGMQDFLFGSVRLAQSDCEIP